MLNEAQRRVVSATLRQAEQALAEQLRLLEGEAPLVLTERVMDVDARTAAELRALAEKALVEIRQLAAVCQVRPAKASVRRTVEARLSILWADLEDTQPHKLHGYGEVTESAVAGLGPGVDRLVTLVHAMQTALATQDPWAAGSAGEPL